MQFPQKRKHTPEVYKSSGQNVSSKKSRYSQIDSLQSDQQFSIEPSTAISTSTHQESTCTHPTANSESSTAIREANKMRQQKRRMRLRAESDEDLREHERTIKRLYRSKLDLRKKSETERIWRIFNQHLYNDIWNNIDIKFKQSMETVLRNYNEDVAEFQRKVRESTQLPICGVCGLQSDYTRLFSRNDLIFNPLLQSSDSSNVHTNGTNWLGYYNHQSEDVPVCKICLKSLKSRRIPKFSRVNVPLQKTPSELLPLNEFEQLLISPVLPLIYVYRYHGYGQYQSKGQCVAFYNDLQTLTRVLPRHPNNIVLNVSSLYGRGVVQVRSGLIRTALQYLKHSGHPGYADISISESNLKALDEFSLQSKNAQTENALKQNKMGHFPSHECPNQNNPPEKNVDPMESLRDQGQQQPVETNFAEHSFTTPLYIERKQSNELRKAVNDIFKSISTRTAQLYSSDSSLQGWPDRFPYLMPDGKGGPIGRHHALTLREWVKYVIQINCLQFHRHIIFICYANIFLRRQKIVGLTARKPVSSSVTNAVKNLVAQAQNRCPLTFPDNTLRLLIKNINVFVDSLPGSPRDMSEFRKDLITMMTKRGPPSYFLTLSAADSLWPETFMEISGGSLSTEQAKNLTAKQRLEMLASHPVRATIAWKKRVNAFMDLIMHGKSKPLGTIKHFAIKAEWQGRLSEHAHILLWTEPALPYLQENTLMSSETLLKFLTTVESVCSAYLPSYEKDQDSSKSPLPDTIRKEPIPLGIPLKPEFQTCLRDLILACQSHICSSYCTNRHTRTCKSSFPFVLREDSIVHNYKDLSGDDHFRVRLRRNHERINNYSLPIINFWRANMDIQPLCGRSFGALVYVAYYTSKTDKMASIHDVVRKLRSSDSNSTVPQQLRKILLSMDSYRPFGAPEAASNLLQYPHRRTSWKVIRIDTRPYLPTQKDNNSALQTTEDLTSSTCLNDTLKTFTENDERFALFSHNHSKTYASIRILRNYFVRPQELEHMSLTEFVEQFETTKIKNPRNLAHYSTAYLNLESYLVRKRSKLDVVLVDLKYCVSPPNHSNESWCLGALVLHIPHRAIRQFADPMSAFEKYAFQKDSLGNPSFPALIHFENSQSELHNVSIKPPHESAIEKDKSSPIKTENSIHPTPTEYSEEEDDIQKMLDRMEESNNEILETDSNLQDLSEEQFSSALVNPKISLKNCPNIKAWSGSLINSITSYGYSNTLHSVECSFQPSHDQLLHTVQQNITFMEQLNNREVINEYCTNDVSLALLQASNDRVIASQNYLTSTLVLCKTNAQKSALTVITTYIDSFYPNECQTDHASKLHPPIIVVVGVPGAGKSWIVSKLRTWCSIRLSAQSESYKTIVEQKDSATDSIQSAVNPEIQNIIRHDTRDGTLGRVALLAMSGAAAGNIRGHTIHSALNFNLKISEKVRSGLEILPPLTENCRNRLLTAWNGVKVVIIDECYTLPAYWLSLIDERLRQLFESDEPFGGLVVILMGDPRQIVPVQGVPLYAASKYISSIKDSEQNRRFKQISKRDEDGLHLYISAKISVVLSESIRLQNNRFAQVCSKASQYQLDNSDVQFLHQMLKNRTELYDTSWLSSIWMFSTWKNVNLHLQLVSKHMATTKGIHRIWSHVSIPSLTPIEKGRKAVEQFYKTSISVGSQWNGPLPFTDYFPGQIICLKKNINPFWGLYNNAKAVIVGIFFYSSSQMPNPLMNMEEAIHLATTNKLPKFELLVKPFLPYTGISAIPDFPGVFCVPWTTTRKKVNGVVLHISGPICYPSNAITIHQAQGGTFDRAVACIDVTCNKYGMANVALSRVPQMEHLALLFPPTMDVLQPRADTSELVEREYCRLFTLNRNLGEN